MAGIAGLDFLDPALVGLLFVGTITGVLAALLGIGGGLLMVPILNVWGATPVQAVATSLVGILLGSTAGSYQNWRMNQLRLSDVLLLAFPAMLTTELGVTVATQLPPRLLLFSFAGLQLLAIYLVNLKKSLVHHQDHHQDQRQDQHQDQHQDQPQHPQSAATPVVPDPLPALDPQPTDLPSTEAPPNDASGERDDSAEAWSRYTETVRREMEQRVLQTQAIGLSAGILAGLFGVGGGVIMVPLQMVFLGTEIKDAVRVSLGAIVLIATSAVTRHALAGNVLWGAGIALGLGTFVGAQVGARVLVKLPEQVVGILFRGLLIFMAGYMIYRGLSLE